MTTRPGRHHRRVLPREAWRGWAAAWFWITAAGCSWAGVPEPTGTGSAAAHGVAPAQDPGTNDALPAPAPGAWRSRYHEPDVSLAAFRAAHPAGPRDQALHVSVLGALPEGADPLATRTLLPLFRAFFQVDVRLDTPMRLPGDTRMPAVAGEPGPRADAGLLLNHLRALCPPAARCIALTAVDLALPELSHVFGLTSLVEGVGVASPRRLADGVPWPALGARRGAAPASRWLQRWVKVATHEVSHAFGLSHCGATRCLMNGMATPLECDRVPLWLCPVCEQKLRHVIGYGGPARDADLGATSMSLGLAGDTRTQGGRGRRESARLAAAPR